MKNLNILCSILLVLSVLTSCAHNKTAQNEDTSSQNAAWNTDINDDIENEAIDGSGHHFNAFEIAKEDFPQESSSDSANFSQPGEGLRAESLIAEDTTTDTRLGSAISDPQKIQNHLDDALDNCQLAQDFWQKGELENAIDALDQAYELILAVDIEDNPKLTQQKEDLRFMISRRILEIYASRNIVLTGNHNEIPVLINKHVQREIDLFTTGREKKFFRNAYKRSGRYRPFIVNALKEAGLPSELSWLPLIESGYKVKALSKARALGLWQFIPSTGYKFGLKRDLYIDERMDPVKSTGAAIGYLTELHKLFGDWTTALAAYNCGEGRVLRLIRKQNLNYLDNFWDLYERLPLETARYVPRFLATLHIINNPEKYHLDEIETDSPLEYETVVINKQIHLKDASAHAHIPYKQLKELNPELRYQVLPPTDYSLRVPTGKSNIMQAKVEELPLRQPPRNRYVYHRVRPGETLSTIARRHRTSVRRIMRANNMRRSHYIVAGKKIKIPVGRGTPVAATHRPAKKNLNATRHVVRRGDSLWIIAKRYGTTTKQIQTLNKLKSTNLHIGQVLKIREVKSVEFDVKDPQKIYLVKRGDSPFKIAQQNKMPLKRLLRLNRLSSSSKIYPGQTLYVE